MKVRYSISGARKCRLIGCPCEGQPKKSRRQQKSPWDQWKLITSNTRRAAQQQMYKAAVKHQLHVPVSVRVIACTAFLFYQLHCNKCVFYTIAKTNHYCTVQMSND